MWLSFGNGQSLVGLFPFFIAGAIRNSESWLGSTNIRKRFWTKLLFPPESPSRSPRTLVFSRCNRSTFADLPAPTGQLAITAIADRSRPSLFERWHLCGRW